MRSLGESIFLSLIHFTSILPSVYFQLVHSSVCYYHSTPHGLHLKDLDRTVVSIYSLRIFYERPSDFPGTVA